MANKAKDEVKLTTWVKPNGTELKLNDAPATVKEAERLGWKRK